MQIVSLDSSKAREATASLHYYGKNGPVFLSNMLI